MRPAPIVARARRTTEGRATALSRRVVLVTAVAVAVTGGLSGCVAVNSGQPGAGRAKLVSDLAARLTRAGGQTYTATYRLGRGDSGTIAQVANPSRVAYTYPGGKLILTPEQAADCRGQGGLLTCTLTPPPSPTTDLGAMRTAELAARGFVPPGMAVALLTAAALEPDAVVTTHDTTIAGENATCVDIKGVPNAAAAQFDVCVTTDGLLGSFSGLVSGVQVDLSLDRYEQTVAPGAFDLPAGATVVDQRPK
jgi:hypothetical protein